MDELDLHCDVIPEFPGHLFILPRTAAQSLLGLGSGMKIEEEVNFVTVSILPLISIWV